MVLGMIPSIAPDVALGRPSGATNLVINGGFETNTTGWSASGTNTIERSTEQVKFGAASGKATYQDTLLLTQYGNLTLTDTDHVFSAFIYVPVDWDGGDISVDANGFTGVTQTAGVANMSLTAQWQRVVCTMNPDAGDLVGTLRIRAASAPTAGRFIYIDGAQVELGLTVTPYVETDGGTASRPAAKWVA